MRSLSLAALALAVTAIIISFSRGGFGGLVVACAFWVLRERRLDRLLVVAAAGLALVVLAPSHFWSRTETVSSFHEDASAMGRVHAWTVASRNAEVAITRPGAPAAAITKSSPNDLTPSFFK